MGKTYKRKNFKTGSLLVILFLGIYIPSLVHWLSGNTTETEILRMGSIEDAITLEGYIIRDEEVLKTPFEGKCITTVSEGAKIPAGFKVATVLNSSSETLLEDMKALDIQIVKAHKEKLQNQDIFSEDINKIENEISRKVRLIQDENNKNSLVNIKQLRADIDGLISKEASIFGKTSGADAYVTSLELEKQKLQQQINANTRDIYSPFPGTVSYMLDGNEEVLKPEGISSLTPKFLENLKLGQMENTEIRNNVQAGKPVAKIIKDIYSNFVFVLEPEQAVLFKVDDSVKVRVREIDKLVDGVVDYKSAEEDGKYIISIKVDRGTGEMSSLRKLYADIVRRSYQGLKVPLKSLRDISEDGTRAKIVLVVANAAKIMDVKIKGKDTEFAIIENIEEKANEGISLYSAYAVNPANIQEGQEINR